MTVTYKEQVLTLKVKVTDTLAPVIEKPKKALKAKVGEEVFIEKMALSVKEASDYTLTFDLVSWMWLWQIRLYSTI